MVWLALRDNVVVFWGSPKTVVSHCIRLTIRRISNLCLSTHRTIGAAAKEFYKKKVIHESYCTCGLPRRGSTSRHDFSFLSAYQSECPIWILIEEIPIFYLSSAYISSFLQFRVTIRFTRFCDPNREQKKSNLH